MSPTHYSLTQITTSHLKIKNKKIKNIYIWLKGQSRVCDLWLKQSFEFHFKDCFGLTIRIEYFGTSMYRYTILGLLLRQGLATNLVVN